MNNLILAIEHRVIDSVLEPTFKLPIKKDNKIKRTKGANRPHFYILFVHEHFHKLLTAIK